MNGIHSPLAAALLALAAISASAQGQLRDFVTRQGDQLVENGKPFRFISMNIPNLQLIEDNFTPGANSAWAWPNDFEIADALESVRQMGGTVARTYVLSVRREGSDMGDFVHVRGPGDFNEEAFRALDLAIEIAGRKGVRLIIPLVDNWQWQGGRAEYAAFRGKEPGDFWTDEQVISDFEKTVRHVLTRVNTRTGVPYRDDPAILGWETGNELDSPPAWTRRIARLMKQLDPNHLVIDGNSLHGVPFASLDDPNVDVITTHHYPNTDEGSFVPAIIKAREQTLGQKPYFVGEFGFTPVEEIERVYDAVIQHEVAGALLWSLRFHHRDGGFYWHSEPSGGELYKAYHWPGFPSGGAYGERQAMQLTRTKAFEIRGLPEPQRDPPAAPRLLPISDPAAISWQGSAGAEDYVVERAVAEEGPWQTVASRVDDSAVPYRPLFNDQRVQPGQSYFYRVIACNEAGRSSPSNVVGPVPAQLLALVDDCCDLRRISDRKGDVRVMHANARPRREDVHRFAMVAGTSVTYEVAGPIQNWSAVAYRADDSLEATVEYSLDGETFQAAGSLRRTSKAEPGDYGYLEQMTLRGVDLPAGVRFIRITASPVAGLPTATSPLELSWIEIRYGG